MQALCYHRGHLWASSDAVPRSEEFGTPPPGGQGLCYQRALLWATFDSVPRSHALGTP